jgi:Pyridoxamine 5'-phosphate oxidase
MGKQFSELSEEHIAFIQAQKLFFVGTATADSRVNVSPKGMDSLRVLGSRRVVWLNVTGSGNESAAHVQVDPRMTLMFCAFEGAPLIMRLYGKARVMHPRDAEWAELLALFPPLPGARQIFELDIDLVQTSCGAGVPLFDYAGGREMLNEWSRKKGEAGVRQYWQDKNQHSIDGIPTHIMRNA